MPTESPWGPVQTSCPIADGINWVCTEGHGGLMIANDQAKRLLSPQARAIGARFGDSLAYEEDCLYAVAFYERPEWAAAIAPDTHVERVKKNAWETLSAWNPEYLLSVGVAPEPKAYEVAKQRAEDHARRTAKDPDLIVSAVAPCSFWPDIPAGSVQVWTADGAQHLVTSQSYRARYELAGLTLLSDCVPFVKESR